MFTGIVEEIGHVTLASAAGAGRNLRIKAEKVLDGVEVGDSIAVNGVCLTVTAKNSDEVDFSAVAETLARTNLGILEPGHRVNLERAMRADGRFDGHIVQGHIDGAGEVTSIVDEGSSRRVGLGHDSTLSPYVVEKGSVSLDGVSLTVTRADLDGFEVVLIPHTLEATIWGERRVGDAVNVEVDLLAKYIERLMEART